MTPQEIIKFVFSEERVDLELANQKLKTGPVSQARHRAIYLIKYFFPTISFHKLGSMLGNRSHVTMLQACRAVTNYIAYDSLYEKEMSRYIRLIREKMNADEYIKIRTGEIEFNYNEKRLIVEKYSLGYKITIERTVNKIPEERVLNISEEIYNGIVRAKEIFDNSK